MIGKFAEKRRDGKTDFAALIGYIGDAEKSDGAVWADNLLDRSSAENIAEQMISTAHMNGRVKDPAVHFVLSWPEDEQPTNEQMCDAAIHALRKLGFNTGPGGHQLFIAVHRNTDNPHVHVAANRVHPIDWKPLHLEWSDRTLSEACREIEIKRGWRHESGLAEVVEIDGEKHIFTRKRMPRGEDRPGPKSGKARDLEAHTGELSFERYLAEQVVAPVKVALKSGDWQELHRTLDEHGVELVPRGKGLFSLRDREREIAAKPSNVKRFPKSATLLQKLGEYQPPTERHPIRRQYDAGAPGGVRDIEREQIDARKAARDSAARERSPGRQRYQDPRGNEEAKIQRQAERQVLFQQYRTEQSGHYRNFQERVRNERTRLKERDRTRRIEAKQAHEAKKANVWAERAQLPHEQQLPASAIRSLIALDRARDLERSQTQRRAELAALQRAVDKGPKQQSWREWLRERADDDPVATRALKGLRYRERDQQPAGGVSIGATAPPAPNWLTVEQWAENAVRDADIHERHRWTVLAIERSEQSGEPIEEPIEEMPPGILFYVTMYAVNEQETILRDERRELDFAIDRGEAIVVLDQTDTTIEQTLRVAAAKWEGHIELFGTDAFVARAAEIAAEIGIQVSARDEEQIRLVQERYAWAMGEESPPAPKPELKQIEHAEEPRELTDEEIQALVDESDRWRGMEGEHAAFRAAEREEARLRAKVTPEEILQARRDADLVEIARKEGWRIESGNPEARLEEFIALHGKARRVIQRTGDGDRWVESESGAGGDAIDWLREERRTFRGAVDALCIGPQVPAAERRAIEVRRIVESAGASGELEREVPYEDDPGLVDSWPAPGQ